MSPQTQHEPTPPKSQRQSQHEPTLSPKFQPEPVNTQLESILSPQSQNEQRKSHPEQLNTQLEQALTPESQCEPTLPRKSLPWPVNTELELVLSTQEQRKCQPQQVNAQLEGVLSPQSQHEPTLPQKSQPNTQPEPVFSLYSQHEPTFPKKSQPEPMNTHPESMMPTLTSSQSLPLYDQLLYPLEFTKPPFSRRRTYPSYNELRNNYGYNYSGLSDVSTYFVSG